MSELAIFEGEKVDELKKIRVFIKAAREVKGN